MKTPMKVMVVAAAVAATLVGYSGSAAARSNIDFNLSIGVPGVVYEPAYVAPPPVVYVPQPAYYPPPVYYAPGYYAPRAYWYGDRHRGWERHEWRERHWRHGHDDD